jgi:Mitochondrial 28S ribosomal protein S22
VHDAQLRAIKLAVASQYSNAVSITDNALHCAPCLVHCRWRDHRDEPRLLPLLCELLLDARCTDAALWRSLLQRMVRRDRLYRPLLLRILPRLSHAGLLPLAQCSNSSSTSSTGSSGSVNDDSNSLAALWETVMRSPLQELLQHAERRTKSEALKAKAAAAAAAVSLGASSSAADSASAGAALSFSASLFYTAPSSTATTTAAASNSSDNSNSQSADQNSQTADSNSAVDGDCIGGKPAAAVVEALDRALYLLRCCPFADAVDAAWFAAAYMTLGARFHAHAVSAALCVQSLQQRVSVLINECLSNGCSAALLLDSIGDSSSSSSSSLNSIAQAVYDAVDAADKHGELRNSSHFQSMVQHLVSKRKAQKLMQLCLSKQLLTEAEELAKLHYAMHATADAATSTSSSCLEQYCSELGIAMPQQQ